MITAIAGEERGEFYVAVGPATRTTAILTQLVEGAGCSISPTIRPTWVTY